MTSKKYIILENDYLHVDNKKVYRIRASKEIEGVVSKNQLGGYIESENNLSHEGRCWISGKAVAMGRSTGSGDAQIKDNARIYGPSTVSGQAQVYNNAEVSGRAVVTDNTVLFQKAEIYGDAKISGNALVYDEANVMGMARVEGNARVFGRAILSGDVVVSGDARVYGSTIITKGTFSGILNHDDIQTMINTFKLTTLPTMQREILDIGENIKKRGKMQNHELDVLKSRLIQHHKSVETYIKFLHEELETIDGLMETYRMFIDLEDVGR